MEVGTPTSISRKVRVYLPIVTFNMPLYLPNAAIGVGAKEVTDFARKLFHFVL